MSDSITARIEYLKLENDVRHLRRLRDSPLIAASSEAVRGKNDRALVDAESRCAATKHRLNDIAERLTASDFWPVVRQGDALGWVERHEETRKLVETLTQYVRQVDNNLREVMAGNRPAAPVASVAPAPMASDEPPRAVKRRRLLQDQHHENESHSTVNGDEYADIRDRLVMLDERLSDMDNLITQQESELYDRVNEQIDAKIEDVNRNPSAYTSADPDQGSGSVNERIDRLGSELGRTGDDITELAQEVASLYTETTFTNAGFMELQKQNLEMKTKIAEVSAYRLL